jgi:hypothetical protein
MRKGVMRRSKVKAACQMSVSENRNANQKQTNEWAREKKEEKGLEQASFPSLVTGSGAHFQLQATGAAPRRKGSAVCDESEALGERLSLAFGTSA